MIPPEHRSEVMTAFSFVAYGALSLPAVLAGVLVTPLGLRTTFEVFAAPLPHSPCLVARSRHGGTRPRAEPI